MIPPFMNYTFVQIADINTNRLSSTQQNELSFQRVTFMSVFGGNVGSNSMLNESMNSTAAGDFSAENSSTNQVASSVKDLVTARCESDDDLKLSVIKNRIKRTGRFLQQKPKVDDNLFGYTYAKHISNRVEKDYSLYYRKVHSQKPQREFPDTVDTMTLMTRLIPRHSPQTNMSSSID